MLLVLTGCGGTHVPSDFTSSLATETDSEQSNSSSSDDSFDSASSFKPQICSDLPFDNISWPAGTDQLTATLFALAMNVSGSFEGGDGWDNISNNFDGQGLSLGLFNQNLGQGSLQPLLLSMRANSYDAMKRSFSSAQFTSIDGMLKKWNGGTLTPLSSKATQSSLDNFSDRISPLDDPALLAESGVPQMAQKASSTRNQVSVDWAVNNLFVGSAFKKEWQTALQKMSASPEYISLQVQAAKYIHNRALGYMKKYNFKEMRAYLFFFDIVVQNGSLTSGVESKYATWVKSNASASETTKLKKILEYRLTLVRPQYVNDVKLRKTALIVGTGTVHGSKRDFRNEYCAPSWSTSFTNKPTLQ